MAKQNIRFAFAKMDCSNAHSVLTHVDAVSKSIAQDRKPRKPRKLSPFTKKVLEIAPLHYKRGFYSNFGIACQILGRRREDIKKTRLKKTLNAVSDALTRLQKKGLIEQTGGYKTKSPEKRREASSADIEKNKGLVHAVLNRGHRFLPSEWRHYFHYEDAIEIGKEGLRKALEHHDPRLGKFSTYAFLKISAEIQRATKQAKRTREIPLDKLPRQIRAKIESSPATDPSTFDASDLELLLSSRLVKPHYIGIYVLKHMYGHGHSEMARHFRTTHPAVRATILRAQGIITKAKRARGIE